MTSFAKVESALAVVDRLSVLLARVTMALLVVLVGAMLYEVVSRRLFNAPTLWAFDLSYMINGTIYLGAAGFTLLYNEHVRIDFLSTRMPARLQHTVNALFYGLLFLPGMGLVCHAAIADALYAFETKQVERVSPWAPIIWPYYTAIAVGLGCLFLQGLAQALRHAALAARPGARLADPLGGAPAEGRS